MSFDKNVFINCPFDEEYRPLFESIIFTTLYLGFNPVFSRTLSSGTVRIDQLIDLIRGSKWGIHDISRNEMNKPLRFNMPFELGIDIGAFHFGSKNTSTKIIAILETEQYDYQKILSDIAGQDIFAHNDDPFMAV